MRNVGTYYNCHLKQNHLNHSEEYWIAYKSIEYLKKKSYNIPRFRLAAIIYFSINVYLNLKIKIK